MDKKYQGLSTKLMYDMVENLRLTNVKKIIIQLKHWTI